MMNLCKYSDIFGKPNTGLHTIRLFDIAVVDVAATFIVAAFFYYLFGKFSYWTYLIGLFLMGMIMHRVFCVRTTVDKLMKCNAQN